MTVRIKTPLMFYTSTSDGLDNMLRLFVEIWRNNSSARYKLWVEIYDTIVASTGFLKFVLKDGDIVEYGTQHVYAEFDNMDNAVMARLAI